MRNNLCAPRAALAIIVGLFSSYCEATTEDRINAAVPLPQSVQSARAALLESLTGGAERGQAEAAIESKLRVRAIECSEGYSPTLFTSEAAIRDRLANSAACFQRHDDSLARWIGLRRVGHLLRMPPLRPIPKSLSRSIVNSQDIREVRFASDAGVILFRNAQSIEVVDLGDGDRVARIAVESPDSGLELSPNARVLAVDTRGQVTLLDVATGESLAHLLVRAHPGFFWLSRNRAFYAQPAMNGPTLTVDFDTGEERPNDVKFQVIDGILPIPGTADEFLLFGGFDLSKLRVTSSAAAQPLLVIDHHTSRDGTVPGRGELTSDGQWLISARQDLQLTSIATLETSHINMAPLELRRAIPLPDPDLLLLEGMVRIPGPNDWPRYVYSMSRKTLALVDTRGLAFPRFIYIPSLKRLGLIQQNRLTPIDTPATQSPIPLEQVQAELTEQMNQYREHFGERPRAAFNIADARRTKDSIAGDGRSGAPARTQAPSGPAIHLGIGDSVSSVERVLRTSETPVPTRGNDTSVSSELRLRDRGIWVLFNRANQAQQYRFEAPFAGNIYGARIGAWMGEIRGKLGRATQYIASSSSDWGDIGIYHMDSGVTIRCDSIRTAGCRRLGYWLVL